MVPNLCFNSEKPHYCPVHKKCWHQWSECTRNSANGGDITLENKQNTQQQTNPPFPPNNLAGQGGGSGGAQGSKPRRAFR